MQPSSASTSGLSPIHHQSSIHPDSSCINNQSRAHLSPLSEAPSSTRGPTNSSSATSTSGSASIAAPVAAVTHLAPPQQTNCGSSTSTQLRRALLARTKQNSDSFSDQSIVRQVCYQLMYTVYFKGYSALKYCFIICIYKRLSRGIYS